DRNLPLPSNILERQIKQFERRLVCRERAAILNNFPKVQVYRLYCIGRVDNLANVRRVRKERGHSLPVRSPRPANGRELLIPLLSKLREPKLSFFARRRSVDHLQVRSHFLAL